MGLFKLCMYGLLVAVFFLALGIGNPQILRPSRTAMVTLSTCLFSYGLLSAVYGGLDLGQRKSKPIIYSLSIVTLLTDLIVYLQLEIMNVNDANNERLILFGSDFPLLLLALSLQIALIIVLSYLGNHLYFRLFEPLDCLIICAERTELDRIRGKIARFRLQYSIREQRLYNAPDVQEAILRNEVIFMFDLPALERAELIAFCYRNQKGVFYSPELYDIVPVCSQTRILDDEMLIGYEHMRLTLPQRFNKRCADIVIALVGLVLCSPLMLAIALMIRREDGGPAIFRQARVTYANRPFMIYKFRTMLLSASLEEAHSATEDDPRITRIGVFLRKYRLDELPQLINILRGEMSAVGPRPEMIENVRKYTRDLPEFAYRTRVKAGLTGYAQIAGKYNTDPKQKLLMDLYYIGHYSFWLDLKLLLETALVFFKKDSTKAFER